ncbi:MAG TPA: TIGR03435 family protein [Acidobacteriaceae bacterium]|nr:TIGR03435 family protein [Acidobacteriaceae bacterium]
MTSELNEWLRALGPDVENHLWQTTAFAGAVWLATLALRRNQARVRYGLWMAASVKFLAPFALLIGLGGMLPRPQRVVAAPEIYTTVDEVTQPFSQAEYVPVAAPAMSWKERVEARLPVALASVWLCGGVTGLVVWGVRWRQVSLALARAKRVESGREFELLRSVEAAMGLAARVGLRMSGESMEPGIFGLGLGISKPVLMWPKRLSERLDDEHIEAILIHELTHVRRRDNLTAALHMLVEALFWFHPGVWWMERRMIEERERACDEAVVAMGSRPEMYAEGLLKAVRFCVESPLTCVAGVTGADLNKRVRSIMTLRLSKLNMAAKMALGAATVVVIAGPIVLGQARGVRRIAMDAVHSAPAPIRAAVAAMASETPPPADEVAAASQPAQDAQSAEDATAPPQPEPAATDHAFAVATIRVADPRDGRKSFGIRITPSGRLESSAAPLSQLVMMAYGGYAPTTTRVDGGPDWERSTLYDIVAKLDDADMAGWDTLSDRERMERMRPMIRRLLVDRFRLQLRMETREVAGYALVQVKGGAKLKEVPPPANRDPEKDKESIAAGKAAAGSTLRGGDGIVGNALNAANLALFVQVQGRRDGPVVDETGLKGYYDFVLKPETHDPQSLVDAVQDQLGLKLVPRKVAVKDYIIVSAQKPSLDGAEGPVVGRVQGALPPSVQRPEFLVATVKSNASGCCTSSRATADQMMLTNQTLKSLVVMAYGVQPEQVRGPDWMEKVRFDITARYPPGTKFEDRWPMLRTLLEDRFKVAAHSETKDMEGYSLMVAKTGFKLKPSEDAGEPVTVSGVDGPVWNLRARRVPMSALTWELGDGLGQVVVDQTGIKGAYDFQLRCSTDSASSPGGAMGEAVPSVFAALEETLGLRLQHGKVQAQMIVVDHVERVPTEN